MTYYFTEKDKLRRQAKQWIAKVKEEFPDQTDQSETHSEIYTSDTIGMKKSSMDIPSVILFDTLDTVSEIFNQRKLHPEESYKIAALNFASYKNPGGMFLQGSSAQEESICHHSNLYPILSKFESYYYLNNKQDINFSLYRDTMIYSPGVVFVENTNAKNLKDKYIRADIITCAAPNRKAAIKYHSVPEEVIKDTLTKRIRFIIQSAYKNNVDNLILGAFGCGVFGNKVEDVASIFGKELKVSYQDIEGNKHKLDKVIFAIPSMHPDDTTFKVFKDAFIEEYFKE